MLLTPDVISAARIRGCTTSLRPSLAPNGNTSAQQALAHQFGSRQIREYCAVQSNNHWAIKCPAGASLPASSRLPKPPSPFPDRTAASNSYTAVLIWRRSTQPRAVGEGAMAEPWLGFSVIDTRFRLSYLTMPKHGASKHALPEARRDSL
jgi:hypothetical protein